MCRRINRMKNGFITTYKVTLYKAVNFVLAVVASSYHPFLHVLQLRAKSLSEDMYFSVQSGLNIPHPIFEPSSRIIVCATPCVHESSGKLTKDLQLQSFTRACQRQCQTCTSLVVLYL